MKECHRRVGVLQGRSQTGEQRAALDWLAEREGLACEPLPLAKVAEEPTALDRYGALWWHADEPIRGSWLRRSGIADRIRRYVADGGGLLLSLLAVPTVVDFGFDPVPPDTVVPTTGSVAGGFLANAVHREHPAFADVAGLRFVTAHPGERTALARYEQRLPENGEILAANYVEGRDVPHEMTLVEWHEGDGVVLGAGANVGFAGLERNPNRRTHSAFVANALSYLAADERPTVPMTARLREPDEFRRVRSIVDADPHRPRYHFCSPANWQNDVSGLVHWNGAYHLFYNHNPAGPFHGTIHGVPNVKGHATSPDLVRWTDRPIALWPTVGGPDEQGVWTGCVVDDGGTPTFVYTGARGGRRYATGGKQRPCHAVATDDDLDTWEKRGTSLLAAPPDELTVVSRDWEFEFRDHCVWREEDAWYQLIGTGIDGEGGAALLYRSPDLVDWEYCNPVLVGDADETGTVWECPELVPLGDRHLLHVSCNSRVHYFLGEFDGRRFHPERRGWIDAGDFYAPQTLLTPDGRRVMFGWIRNRRRTAASWNAGWAGAMSLPRELGVHPDGDLAVRPAPEVESLRGEPTTLRDVTLAPGSPVELGGAASATAELAVEIDPGDASEVGLVVRRSPDGEERTPIRFRPDEEVLTVDRSRSSRDATAVTRSQEVPAPPSSDGRLRLRVFVDRSVIEVFVDDRRCLTSRVYPTRTDSTGIELYARGGRARATTVSAWPMASIW